VKWLVDFDRSQLSPHLARWYDVYYDVKRMRDRLPDRMRTE
jgi:hypothetical protein